jgi:hypothetical protein
MLMLCLTVHLSELSAAATIITIGNVSAPLSGDFGNFTPTLGGFSSEVGSKGHGLSPGGFALLDFSSTFTQNGLIADANLRVADEGFVFGRTLDFKVSSETFVVSTVPLPPALPLFASALLILGIVGYARRTKGVTAVQT